jgi:Tol biopolymer transport system component
MIDRKLKPVHFFFLAVAFFCVCGNTENTKQEKVSPSLQGPEFPISGSIVFHSNLDGDNEIYLLEKNSIFKLTDNTWNDEYPAWSPDGRSIAYTADPQGNYDIFVMKADGSQITRLTTAESNEKEPAWYPDGKSIAFSREIKKFIRKQLTLWRVDIPTKNTERIIPGYNKGHAIPHLSPLGGTLTFTGKRTIGWDCALYDMRKKQVTFLDEGGKSCRARFSKDGKKLAYVSSKADGKGDIWIMNPDGTGKKRLTGRDEKYDYFPSWSPDGKFIVFNSSHQHDHNGDWALYIIDVQTQEVRLLFDSPGNDVFPDWR